MLIMNIKKITPNNVLYKSNSLINSLYDLSLQEQRIILILISMVNPREDKEFINFEMPVEMFKNIIGLDSKGGYYQELEEVVKKLMKRSFKIDRPEGDGWLRINWLSSCEYKKGAGCIELEISAKLHPYLLDLKSHYTSYRLKNILPLRSGYSIRIYELLKQYETIGERYLTLEEMRKLMEIKDAEYSLYADFKRKIILQAQKELLEKTDICFEFKEKKRVRRVIGIYFFIKKNAPEEDKTIDMVMSDDSAVPSSEAIKSITNIELYQRLLNLGFTPAQAKILLVQYDETRLTDNLNYVDFKKQQGNIENLPAYTTTIIKKDVRLQSNLFDVPTVEQQPAINLENGMEIEIAGKKYIYADDHLSTGKRSGIPTAMLKQMIRNGEAKIVG
jgi:plasmid replication initiation protein